MLGQLLPEEGISLSFCQLAPQRKPDLLTTLITRNALKMFFKGRQQTPFFVCVLPQTPRDAFQRRDRPLGQRLCGVWRRDKGNDVLRTQGIQRLHGQASGRCYRARSGLCPQKCRKVKATLHPRSSKVAGAEFIGRTV